jgi:lipid-A-disaccharide synthase
MRIFFSVGEPSGDLHGSNLIRRLKSADPGMECVGFGGPKMAAAGCDLHFELTTMAVMFLSKVVANLRFFFRLIDQANDYFETNDVDAVVLIDYPGFNWWIARKAKKHNIPVFYYGVPQVWAWAPWRVRKIRRLVDHVLCKLPFEVDWFAQRDCPATYVGHPYFDELAAQQYDSSFMDELLDGGRRLVTLLPGSRDQEVENNLPILLESARHVQDEACHVKVVVACFNDRQYHMAETCLAQPTWENLDVELFVGKTPELMKAATVCLACSGSVSMELLYHRKPTVIVFKVKRWMMLAQGVLLRTKFITLANLIAVDDIRRTSWSPYDPDAVDAVPVLMPEYLTAANPAKQVAAHAIHWLADQNLYRQKTDSMDKVATKFAKPGATDKAADFILSQLGYRLDRVSTDRFEELNCAAK